MELWVKQYLGLFFDFENYGILNWIAIPLLIYFLITIKKRKRWEIALAFIFVLSFLSISSQGRNNPRYIFTLYPFTLGAILLIAWEFIKKKNHYVKIGILIICGIAVFFNIYHFRDTYKFYWKYKVIVEDDYFPHGLFKFINNIKDLGSDSMFLVCSHRHLFFYHTNKKGIYHGNPKMRIFYRQRKNKEAALEVLKNQLKVKYILLHRNFNARKLLRNIITRDCDLLYQDKFELSLYRIREKDLDKEDVEKDLDKEELEKIFINDSLLRNGSFENWKGSPSKSPDFFEGIDSILREEKEVKVGKYSAKITGDNFNFYQNLPNFEDYRGKKITCFAWIKTNVPHKYRIQIYDGAKSSFSFKHSGDGKWELLQANHTIDPSAKYVLIRVIQAAKTGKTDDIVYVDGAILLKDYWNTYDLYSKHLKKEE